MKATKIDLPGKHRDFSGSTIHVEAWRLGECLVYLSRENFADARSEKEFRWRMTISVGSRYPTMEEIIEARKLAPEGIHFAMPFPHRAYWLMKPKHAVELIEVKDKNLTDQVEYEAIERRERGFAEVWVDERPTEDVG